MPNGPEQVPAPGPAVHSVRINQPATPATFNEAGYLAANPDVADAVRRGIVGSGRQHFELYGIHENRRLRLSAAIKPLRRSKLKRLRPALRTDMPHVRRGDALDFLTDELRIAGDIVDTSAVSAHPYSPETEEMIARYPQGLILDCGAGLRDVYYDNVVNFEIVGYDTTDVLGIGERLPFKDGVFDAVISIAVLEHVKDPFACAREIARVLKPGGELLCNVPFLQPLHGYPHHYYNMTHQGLRALFEPALVVDDVRVPQEGLPVWTLTWIIQSWASGLPEPARSEFLSMRLQDLMQPAPAFLNHGWVTQLPEAKNIELACLNSLRARKPG